MSEAEAPRRHTKHVFRVFILLGIVLVALLVVRYTLLPRGWGKYGNYRAGAVAEMMAIDPEFGNRWSCMKCHEDEWATRYGGSHKSVPCEDCHDALSSHVRDGERVKPMPVDRSYALCARCHRKIQGRPAGFPQVKLDEHIAEQGGSFGSDVCIDCHESHDPLAGLR